MSFDTFQCRMMVISLGGGFQGLGPLQAQTHDAGQQRSSSLEYKDLTQCSLSASNSAQFTRGVCHMWQKSGRITFNAHDVAAEEAVVPFTCEVSSGFFCILLVYDYCAE